MTTKIRIILVALAVAVSPSGLARATEPASAAVTGRVLLLDNGHLLEGEVTRVGDQYRVRRQVGETWVPADKARCLCDSLEQAYLYLRGQANAGDPDERLRLARWCQLHGLRAQALAE